MIISLFSYKNEINLTKSNYNGITENVTMFQDKIVIHRNMDNVIHFKITDRDRVRFRVNEESDYQIGLRIIDDKKVVVSKMYLTPKIEGDFFSTIIPKEMVNSLSKDDDYTFIVTFKENGIETPLYTDHDFNAVGTLEILENYADTVTDVYSRTEPYVFFSDGKVKEKKAKHVFSTILPRDEKLYSVRLKTIENDAIEPQESSSTDQDNDFINSDENDNPETISGTKSCYITIEKSNQGYYPFNEKAQQWDEVVTLPHYGNTEIPIVLIPERVYMRVVIHTEEPERFELVVEKLET